MVAPCEHDDVETMCSVSAHPNVDTIVLARPLFHSALAGDARTTELVLPNLANVGSGRNCRRRSVKLPELPFIRRQLFPVAGSATTDGPTTWR